MRSNETTGAESCALCPQPGTNCSAPGATLSELWLAPGYWRESNASVVVLPCPDEQYLGELSGCGGGVAPCREAHGSGVLCSQCPEHLYKDPASSACLSCDHVQWSPALPAALAALVLATVVIRLCGCLSRRLALAVARRVPLWMRSPMAQLKIIWCGLCPMASSTPAPHCALQRRPPPPRLPCRSFVQVVSCFEAVYRVDAPRNTRRFLASVGFRPDPYGAYGLGSLLECRGLGGFLPAIAFWVVAPIALTLLAFVYVLAKAWCRRRRNEAEWLAVAARGFLFPYLLLAFLAHPHISSLAFRAFDCEEIPAADQGHPPLRFLRYDHHYVDCGPAGDPTAEYAVIRQWAVSAVVLHVVGMPVALMLLLHSARAALRREQPVPLSRALDFLHKAYEPHVFWWELVETARKFCLVAVAVWFGPGSVMQLVWGLLVAVTFLCLRFEATPYRSEACDHLAFSADLLLVLLFVLFLVFKIQILVEVLHASTPHAAHGYDPARLFSTDSLVTTVLMAISLLVTLALSTIAFFGNVIKERSAQHVLRWRRDSSPVAARPLLAGRSHVFISHNWRTGQDQSRTIKGALCGLVPSLKVWLDVDDMRSKAGTKATNTCAAPRARPLNRAMPHSVPVTTARTSGQSSIPPKP